MMRIIVLILIFSGLVTLTFLIIRPFEQTVRKGIADIRDNLLLQIEEITGLKVEYDSANPSFFGNLDIRNIRLLRSDNSIILSISRLRLSYSFLSLLKGDFSRGFHTMRIDRPILSLDFMEDEELLRLFSAENSSDDALTDLSGLIPDNFQIRIRNGECEALNGSLAIKIRNFVFDGNIGEDRIIFSGRWNTQVSADPVFPAFLTVPVNAGVSGDFSLKNGEGSAIVNIPSFSGDSFRLQSLSFSFYLQGRKLEIRKVYDRTPLDIAVFVDLETSELSSAFRVNNFSPRNLVTLTGSLEKYNSLLAARLSGQLILESRGEKLNYSMELTGMTPDNQILGVSTFIISAAGNENGIEFRDLLVDSAMGTINYRGTMAFDPLTPRGILSFSNVHLREDGNNSLNGRLEIFGQGQDISVLGKNIQSGGLEISELKLDIYQEEAGLSFICSAIIPETGDYAGINTSRPLTGSLLLEGSLDYEPGRIEASLKLNSFPLRNMIDLSDPFIKFYAIPGWIRTVTGNFYVSTEIFFTTDFEHTLYNAPSIVIQHEGGQEQEIEASLSGTDRRFELDQGRVTWKNGNAGISGLADFSNPDDISFAMTASYQELTYNVSGVILDREFVSVRGSYGFEVFFSSSGTRGYSGYAQGINIPIPVNNQNAFLNFLFSLRYDSPDFWTADIDRFEIVNIPSPVSLGAIRLSGGADQNGAELPNVLFENELGLLTGTLAMNWDPEYQNFDLSAGMASPEGYERYRLNAAYSRNAGLELNLATEGMILDRFSSNFQNGTATGSIKLDWESAGSFAAELFFPSVSFQIYDQMARGTVRASLNDSEFLLNDIKINYGPGFEAVMPYFRIDRANGIAETRAAAAGSIGGRELELSLLGNAEFRAVESWLDLAGIFNSFHGTLTMDTARYDTQAAEEPFRFDFSVERDEKGPHISLDGGPRNMVRFRWSPADNEGGNIYAALSAPSPIRGSFTGYMDSRNIDIRIPDLYADMNSLWKFVPPNEFVAFPGGIVTGSVHITGPLRDPEFYGTARATSLKIQVPLYLPEDIRPIPILINMEGNEMSFGPVHSQVGNGYGMVSGWFIFERWIPYTFGLDIRVAPENAIPAAFDVSGVYTRGRVSGNLILAMEDMIFDVYGELTAHNTEITLNSAEISAAQNSPQANTGPVSTMINVEITSGRQVEFFWPSVEFPMLQANADIGSKIRIISDVIARRFSFTGDVKLRGGEIFYLERNFYLREGTLFFNENESRFEPRISARAEIRDQSDEGPVTVSMIIENAPLQSFVPRFVSNPPLSQIQILSLLGQNQTRDPADPNRDTNILLAFTADAITQFTVMRTLQREIRNFFGLDMFSIRTRLLQNMVFQATGLQNSGLLSTGTGNYFDNTTVFLGKYLGPDIFVESMFSWRYDPAKQDWGGLKLEPEIGLEMRNPLFNVRMNMLLLHPENWFINDITFTLSWRWSF